MFICEKCGKQTQDIVVGDLTNMTKDLTAICEGCREKFQVVREGNEIKGYSKEYINPFKVAQQLNPDISCDFCDKPDPMWLYDLKMEPMVFGTEDDSKIIDLGTRWATCDECSKDAAEKSPIGTTIRMGVTGNVTNIMQIHGMVMEHISNKRAYVRDTSDGVIKQL